MPTSTLLRRHAVAGIALLALAGSSFLTLVPGPALAAPSATDAAEFDGAWQQFQRAVAGDKNAVEPAADAFGKLSARLPADPVLRAYAGAATAMRANTTLMPWKKMGFAEDGLALIDQALAGLQPAHDAPTWRNVPASLDARFTAASTFLALPGMFNRRDRGAKLLDEVANSPLLAAAPAPFKAAVQARVAAGAKAQQ